MIMNLDDAAVGHGAAVASGERGDDHVLATYRISSYYPLEHAAEVLAGEQSTGTFLAVPRETQSLQQRHRARVVAVHPLPASDCPALPGAAMPARSSGRLNHGTVDLSFPVENFGPSIPNLMAAVLGNLFELRELAGIRLMDLQIPAGFTQRYAGPAFGIAGTRQLLGVPDDVMVGTIVKPSVGLQPEELREVVRELVAAGVDFIKDDELTGNPSYSPLAERVRVVTEEIDRGAQQTGKRVMYAFNITDDADRVLANHDLVVEHGGNCVMVCINLIGLGGVAALRKHAQVPIHGHRAMLGALMRHPSLGIDFVAFQKLARLAGVDHLHVSGMDSKFYETNQEVRASVRSLLRPLFDGYQALPVLSSGQWAGTAPVTFELLATTDLLVLAGGGIHGHPAGVAAGTESIRQAWQAAAAGVPLDVFATRHEPLRLALSTFGDKENL
jgi:ribulose-bisphosphate carboxylase large chain